MIFGEGSEATAPERAVAIAVGLTGLALFSYPELLSGFHRMQWDIGDTRLVNLVLEQSYRWVKSLASGGTESLWDPPYFYPAQNVAGYTDVLLGEAPIYWLARWLGLSMDTAMQCFMGAVAALNFGVAYLWLRRPLGFRALAAAAGAFLFAFGYPRGVQLGHPALQPQFPMLLALYGLWRLFAPTARSASTPRGMRAMLARPEAAIALFFVGVALQLLTGFYLGWFLVLGIGVAMIASAFSGVRRRALFGALRGRWLVLAVGVAATACVIGPMAVHYLAAAREVGLRPFSAVFPPRIQAWLYLGHESLLYRWQDLLKGFRQLDYGPEQKIGIGFVTTCFVGLGWRRLWKSSRPGSAIRLLGIVSLILFVLCTEFYPGVKLWGLVYRLVPGAKAIRALSRIGLVLLVPEAVGLAAFVEGLWLAARERRAWAAVMAVLLVVTLEQAHRAESFDKLELRAEVTELRDRLDSSCRYFYYSPWTDGGEAEYRYQIDAMWAAYESGIPTLNGYSGNSPPGWGLTGSLLQSSTDEVRLGGAIVDWVTRNHLDPSGLCWVKSP